MRLTALTTFLITGFLLVAVAATAHAQATDQGPHAHHPEETRTTPEAQAPGTAAAPPAAMNQGNPGMVHMMSGAGSASPLAVMGNHGVIYGMPEAREEMAPQRVRAFPERYLAWHDNPRLKLGKISKAEDGSITAKIVTIDGSSVQKFAFNRYPGLFRQVQ